MHIKRRWQLTALVGLVAGAVGLAARILVETLADAAVLLGLVATVVLGTQWAIDALRGQQMTNNEIYIRAARSNHRLDTVLDRLDELEQAVERGQSMDLAQLPDRDQ